MMMIMCFYGMNYVNFKCGIIAKCALMQTLLSATLRASSLRASRPVTRTVNSNAFAMLRIGSIVTAHKEHVTIDMRITANYSQVMETPLSTCTEPWFQGSIATLENQLVGPLPHTQSNPRRIVCADLILDLSGQLAANLKTVNDCHSMQYVRGN